MKWICSQIGAREHYAVPRVLHLDGRLQHLYTDFWASAPWRILGRGVGRRGMETRFHRDLQAAHVTSFNLLSLRDARHRPENPYEGFLATGEAFGRRVTRSLELKSPAPDRDHVFFGYDTGFLEPATWFRERGGNTVVCQMDPSRLEVDLVKAEERRWSGWARHPISVPEAYFLRREEEWRIADLVMVNSEWTRQALLKQGAVDEKIVVVPLAYETGRAENHMVKAGAGESASNSRIASFSRDQPLRVLFLGQVILRKGIQYLIESARLLEREPIRFDIVGSIGISDSAIASAPSNMTFHGPVRRDRTEEFYERADVFVLPTISDGFAMTQLEAMARGLPVITTPNCGDVVSDGVDGVVIPACDSMALAESFQLLLQDPAQIPRMASAAGKTIERFGLESLSANLRILERSLR